MKNKQKKIIIVVLISVIVLGADFYAGMFFSSSRKTAGGPNQPRTGQNLRFAGRQNDFLTGDVLSKDDKSITLKLSNRGSRVVLFSDSTEVGKFVSGSIADIEIGKSVIATGKTNQDGSITAQSIQIRPEGMNLPGQGPQNNQPKP